MKKTLFIVLLGLLCLSQLQAQTNRGSICLGLSTSGSSGNINFLKNNRNSQDVFSFNLSPTIGVFVKDNFLLGGLFRFGYSHLKNELVDFSTGNGLSLKSSTTTVQLGPIARYYFGENKLRPYLNATLNFGMNNSKFETLFPPTNEIIELKDEYTSIGASGGFGLAYFINEKLSLDIQAGLSFESFKLKESNSRTNNIAVGLSVGFSLFK